MSEPVCKFLKLSDLESIFEAKARGISPSEFIIKPQNQELKEMWCAFRFGLGYEKLVGPCTICVDLEENSDADFVIKNAVGDFPFQSIISDVPERHMGDDFNREEFKLVNLCKFFARDMANNVLFCSNRMLTMCYGHPAA